MASSILQKNKIVEVGSDGKAPSGLSAGDIVVTGGGSYMIGGVNSDGSYKSSKVSDTTTSTYTGKYDSVSSSRDYNSGLSKDYTPSYSYSGSSGTKGYKPTGEGSDYWADATEMSDYSKKLLQQLSAMWNATDNPELKELYHSMAEQERAKYGYLGGSDGSNYINILTADAEKKKRTAEQEDADNTIAWLAGFGNKPEFESDWQKTADMLAKAALEMKYDDWLESDQYRALAERYGLQGRMSMQDVLGQVSSRTGGLASSYATTAAQQQYNSYMANLENAARQMYSDERGDAIENAQLALNYSDSDYQRYLGELAQYNDDRSFAYKVLADAINQSNYKAEFENMLKQQDIENERYNTKWNYGVSNDEYAKKMDAQNQISAWVKQGMSASSMPQSVKEASGWTDDEINRMSGNFKKSEKPEKIISKGTTSKGFLGSDGSDYGSGYSSIYKNVRDMVDIRGKTPDEVLAYLEQHEKEGDITRAGINKIYDNFWKFFGFEEPKN